MPQIVRSEEEIFRELGLNNMDEDQKEAAILLSFTTISTILFFIIIWISWS